MNEEGIEVIKANDPEKDAAKKLLAQNAYPIHRLLLKHPFFMGNILICLGIFIAFYGNAYPNILMGLFISSTISIGASEFIYYRIESKGTDVTNGEIGGTIAAFVVTAAVLVFVMAKWRVPKLLVLGAACGMCAGILLTTAFFISNSVMFWLLISACILFAMVLTFTY